MRRKALKQKKIWNPALLESGIHLAGIRNPVLGIRNPQGGIQNPRLSWIPLHGANQDLDTVIKSVLTDFPQTGYKRMTGFLRARGLIIQQSRIRAAMRRTKPVGTLLRALGIHVIRRRSYQVAGPLALWHVDGNHKLIRGGIWTD